MRLFKYLKYVYYAIVIFAAFMCLMIPQDLAHPNEAAYLYPIDAIYVSIVTLFILQKGLAYLKKKTVSTNKPLETSAPASE